MSLIFKSFSPIISEKSSFLSKNRIYPFYVNKALNKLEIKNYLSSFFSVKVMKVNSINLKKLKKRKRLKPKKYIQKKVYVTISSDSNLDRINSIFWGIYYAP